MSTAIFDNLKVAQVSETIAAVSNSVDANLSKYAFLALTTFSPAILVGLVVLGGAVFAYVYFKKNPQSDSKNFIVLGAVLLAFAMPSTLSEIQHGRLWIASIFALAYIIFSPFFIRKIFQYSQSLTSHLMISVVKVLLYALGVSVILGTIFTTFIPTNHSQSHTQSLVQLTLLLKQLFVWVLINAAMAFTCSWHKKTYSTVHGTRIPYSTLIATFTITSAFSLFSDWLPLIPLQLALVNTSIFLLITAIALSSILYRALSSMTDYLCSKFFSQGMLHLFPIARIITIFFMASSIIIVGNLFDAYNMWIDSKPLVIVYVEKAVLRIVFAFTSIALLNRLSFLVRNFLKEHEHGVKRVGTNRRLLSISAFVQGIFPFLLKALGCTLALVTLGVPFQYIATAIFLTALFLSFIGKKVLEDMTQGLLHTIFGGHLAIGDLIEVKSPIEAIGFVETITLYNITLRSRTTGALQIISFSDLRNFVHHDRERARVLAKIFVPLHISWGNLTAYIEETIEVIQQSEMHSQFFLGQLAFDIEEYTADSILVRVGFDTLIGDGRQFVMKRVFLTEFRKVLDKNGVCLAQEYTLRHLSPSPEPGIKI